ncbi:MAG: hypothetical protein L0221_12000, partial [Chloroflexi bacterium]|nr:hypothetical protein [Chloroflexota bacterium]
MTRYVRAWGAAWHAADMALERRERAGRVAPVGAAIDVGSNSVHALVAEVHGHRLAPLVDTSEFLGLGRAVDGTGELGPALTARLTETLAGYVERARELGAGRVVILGTDPLRRASDARGALDAVATRAAVRPVVLGHDEEALLTLLGVTAGRPVVRELVVVDIGGGSSEV